MLLTRRWFLLGSAATLAATQANLILPNQEIIKPTLIPLHSPSRKMVYEIFIAPNGTGEQYIEVEFSRANAVKPIFHWDFHERSYYRWWGRPSPICFPEGETWNLTLTPETGSNATMHIIYEADKTSYVEYFRWSEGILIEKNVQRLPEVPPSFAYPI